MERLTEKHNGKNVIPLRRAVCGVNLPYWSISGNAYDLERFFAGDAVDRLAAYEDTGLEPTAIKQLIADNAELKDDVDFAAAENTALYSALPKWNPAITPPSKSGRYIICCYDGYQYRVSFANYQRGYGRWDLTGARSYWRVTHWMPMPEPPLVAPTKEGNADETD